MKKLLLILAAALLMSNEGCEVENNSDPAADVDPEKSTTNREIEIITIDEHEYILWDSWHGRSSVGGICHSESCPNSIHSYH